jgi:outer membrane protein assembly factor BamE (lipoprotein component of BamABCDE complex)
VKRMFTLWIPALLLCASIVSGCAFGSFGKADMTYQRMNVPQGLAGLDKEQVLKGMGIPDSTTRVGDKEYWDYNNRCGYFVLLFGKTIEKDLILDFRDGKVASAFLVDKGSSTGLISNQGSIAR